MHNLKITFPTPTRQAVFIKRQKRFTIFAQDVLTHTKLLAHTNNTGSMLGLLKPGRKVILSLAQNKNRKLPYTLEAIHNGQIWIGVNTAYPNQAVKLLWQANLFEKWQNSSFQAEVFSHNTRLDACLLQGAKKLWIEAKNVTLVEDDVAYFPDAKTKRGVKHLQELIAIKKQGLEACCFYLVQREDAKCFAPADFIDSEYANWFWKALEAKVKVMVVQCQVHLWGISLKRKLKVISL
ncbi:MAG: DNA/RNA nuclease SfsA [Desulfonauticus sp.]|nr:DNA/RNA nuclease SfsA [Desulfonauticus sp.]